MFYDKINVNVNVKHFNASILILPYLHHFSGVVQKIHFFAILDKFAFYVVLIYHYISKNIMTELRHLALFEAN